MLIKGDVTFSEKGLPVGKTKTFFYRSIDRSFPRSQYIEKCICMYTECYAISWVSKADRPVAEIVTISIYLVHSENRNLFGIKFVKLLDAYGKFVLTTSVTIGSACIHLGVFFASANELRAADQLNNAWLNTASQRGYRSNIMDQALGDMGLNKVALRPTSLVWYG